jgi:hypothetical protein
VFIDRDGFPLAKEMCLARFSVPGLDQIGQEPKPSETNLERHPGIRIQLFSVESKARMNEI